MTKPPRRYRIGVIAGDGIGPEVTAEALRVVEAVAGSEGFGFEAVPFDLGAERYLRTGEALTEEDLENVRTCDAVLLGAVGDPRVAPGALEIGLLLRLRQELDLYVNLRPARLFDGVPGALAAASPDDLDLVIVRENTEGLYSRQGQAVRVGGVDETVTELSINTAHAVRRIVQFAFELAQKRGRNLTLVHKTNVLERSGKLWTSIFEKIAAKFPTVPTTYQHVDAAALLLVSDPARFGVIVTDNMFGDILSDLAAALVGGIGLVGSGNIHPGRTSIFEPVHGSAPDIAGTGKANPIGAIASAALLLRHLGEAAAAERIEKAVASVAGKVMESEMNTSQIGELVAEVAA